MASGGCSGSGRQQRLSVGAVVMAGASGYSDDGSGREQGRRCRALKLCGSGGEGGKFGRKTFGPPPWFK